MKLRFFVLLMGGENGESLRRRLPVREHPVRGGSPALKPHSCSCKMCQRHSGAVTLEWVEFPAEKLRWTGPGGKPSTWRSSDFSSRSFCPTCGSTLGAIDDKPVVALVLGSFDSNNRQELAPQYHSHVGKKPKWAKA